MVQAQSWLTKKYPLDKREGVTHLFARNSNLEDELIIENFPNLESIHCESNNELASIKLINLPNLTNFNANGCRLNNLEISNCPNLTSLNVANNLLTDTSFLTNLNPEKLTCLSIHSNNFQEQDLSFLSQLTKLEQLFLDNHDQGKFNRKIYNRFIGSLQSLRNLTSLKYLNVANTDLDTGLECLPDNLRKICLINSWQRKEAGYLKIRWQLERVARFSGMTEKLQQKEKNEPLFVENWYRLAPWKKAQKLLGKAFGNQTRQWDAQSWLDENIPLNTNRQHYKELDLSDKNLVGELDLSDFTNLGKLNCSYNQLTNLVLTNCSLIELNCSNNSFTNTEFLKLIPNPEKLEKLELNNNELKESLDFLTSFTNLRELNLSHCSFFGSLEPLEKSPNLKKIAISHTDINSGLDYLSDNCWELSCDPETKSKSEKISNILTKYLEERNGQKYYNLVKWREEWRNNIISSIPTERLFVIRSNIKKFINKWGKEAEKTWYDKLRVIKEKDNLNELDRLQDPNEFNAYWYTGGIKWIARAGATAGGILALNDYPNLGGALATSFPFIETISSRIEEDFYDAKQKKWEEFIADSEEFLDSYHELLGILEPLQGYRLGKINEVLDDLNGKVKKFLDNYDQPNKNGEKNGIIDIYELTNYQARKKLVEDLNKEDKERGGGSQLGDIVLVMKKLEEEIRNYHRGFYYGVNEENNQSSEQNQEKGKEKIIHSVIEVNHQVKQQNSSNSAELTSLVEQPPKN